MLHRVVVIECSVLYIGMAYDNIAHLMVSEARTVLKTSGSGLVLDICIT